MHIYIKYKNKLLYYKLDNNLNISIYNNNDINIKLDNNKLIINLYNNFTFKDLSISKVINKNNINIYYNNIEFNIIIFKKFKYKFNKYKLINDINIGSNLMNDIIINRSYINNLYGRIQDNIIYNDHGIFVNEQLVYKHLLKVGDVIRIYDLIILYHKDFIMINKPNDITINLDSINIKEESILDKVLINNNIRYYNGYKELDLDIKLKDISMYKIYNKTNILISIGPIITLSSASILLAIININNKGLNNINDILPIILFPTVMLLSAIIWQPLNTILNKLRINKDNNIRNNNYISYLNTLRYDINNKINIYKDIYNKSILNIYELNYNYKKHIYIKNPYCNDYLRLYIGISNIKSNIKFKYNIKDDDPLYYIINNLIQDYKYLNNFRMYIDLKKYNNIGINNDEIFIKMILIQIMIYYNYKHTKLILFINDNTYKDMTYLNYIPNCFNNNNLLLINDINSLNNVKNNINSDTNYICLIYDNKYINDININNRYNIYIYNDLLNFNQNIDILINVNDGIGNINILNNEYKFKYDKVYTNIKGIGQYIKNNYCSNILDVNHSFYSLHNINNEILNIYNTNNEHLIAYIGYDKNNNPITLDLTDKAQGPHGLIAGTTGSGKSELISSMILSLAYRYKPEQVSFVIIDYKGSGLINNFINKKYKLNHILKTISNLDNDNIKRVLVSIKNECINRQKLFNELTNITNVNINSLYMYQSYYKEEYNLDKLGHLIIIIDEFAELKQQYNNFIQELVSVSRIGRSLGLHLILSTQRPTNVVSSEILANTRFKICLKVNDASDSYEILKTKDASLLKNPGEFYLKVDDDIVYGKTVLCNTSSKYYDYNNNISILDYKYNTLYKNYKNLDKSNTQLEQVIYNINKYTTNIKSNIWLNPLVTYNYNQLINKYNYTNNEYIIGEYDDILNSKQGLIKYNINNNDNILYISNNIKSIKLYIDSLSYYLLNNNTKDLYIIDNDYNLYNNILEYYPNRIILNNNDYNLNYLYNKELKDSIIIVRNINNDKLDNYIYDNIKKSKLNNNNIIIIDSNYDNIKIKYYKYINYYIGINISSNDIINYYDYKYKDYIFNEYNGLIKYNNKVLYINLYNTIYNDCYNTKGKDIFNKIPNNIKPIYYRNKLLLGYNTNTLKGIYYKNNILIITGYNKEYIFKYYNYLKELECITYNKLDNNKILLIDKDSNLISNNMIIVGVYDNKFIDKYKEYNISYLWLGKDINNQYSIYSTNKYLDNNQGLYIDDKKEELGYF